MNKARYITKSPPPPTPSPERIDIKNAIIMDVISKKSSYLKSKSIPDTATRIANSFLRKKVLILHSKNAPKTPPIMAEGINAENPSKLTAPFEI